PHAHHRRRRRRSAITAAAVVGLSKPEPGSDDAGPRFPDADWRTTLKDGGLVLALVLVVATVLRGVALNEQLWLDEVLMLHDFVREPLTKTVASFPNDNNHPLYSLLAS